MTKKHRYQWYILVGVLLFTSPQVKAKQYGVTRMPIADLFGTPKPATRSEVPHAPDNPSIDEPACPRLHQLLFNERVEILECYEDTMLISIPQAFCTTRNDPHLTQYWVNKNAIMPFDELRSQQLNPDNIIPPAIHFAYPESVITPAIVTLSTPFTDTQTQQTFSAGTRFLKDSQTNEHKHTIQVVALDAQKAQAITLHIPRTHCLTHERELSPDARIKQFVSLLKEWAHEDHNGFIPYVWGGV